MSGKCVKENSSNLMEIWIEYIMLICLISNSGMCLDHSSMVDFHQNNFKLKNIIFHVPEESMVGNVVYTKWFTAERGILVWCSVKVSKYRQNGTASCLSLCLMCCFSDGDNKQGKNQSTFFHLVKSLTSGQCREKRMHTNSWIRSRSRNPSCGGTYYLLKVPGESSRHVAILGASRISSPMKCWSAFCQCFSIIYAKKISFWNSPPTLNLCLFIA